MHDRFSFVSIKHLLQWKLLSVPGPPEYPPFPCRSSGFPWMDMESRTTSQIPTCQGLGGVPANQDQVALCKHPICLPRSSRAWLAVSCEQLVVPCVAPPLSLSHHVPQGWLSPAFLLALHAMNQRRVPAGDRVSPPALLKSFSTKYSWLNKW